MFNWVNPEESLSNSNVKPILVERGPYVFREVHEKLNLTWNDNGTVSYWQRRTWYFEPTLSNGTLSDEITSVNVVAVTVANMIDQIHIKGFEVDLVKKIMNLFLKNAEKKLYIRKTVKELLFEGYEDGILDLLKKIEPIIHIPVEARFGWFYPRNTSATYDGLVNIHTGVEDVSQLGMMGAWNYMNETPYYTGQCGTVRGSAGDLYPPTISQQEFFSIYATDICSGIKMQSTKEATLIKDLPGIIFKADKSVFDNGTQSPESSCYCPGNNCSELSGIRDLSPCKKGAPAFLSFPHFYRGDPALSGAIQGLKPNMSKHEFSLILEKHYLRSNSPCNANPLVSPTHGYSSRDGRSVASSHSSTIFGFHHRSQLIHGRTDRGTCWVCFC
uniref:Protein croquemort n=1 Tax=Cacopsylla melanoneura TaxID=428564 RepID=A0A8D9BJP9_9HEMI